MAFTGVSCGVCRQRGGGRWGALAPGRGRLPVGHWRGGLRALESEAWPSGGLPRLPGLGDARSGVASVKPAGHCPTCPVRPAPLTLSRSSGLRPQQLSLCWGNLSPAATAVTTEPCPCARGRGSLAGHDERGRAAEPAAGQWPCWPRPRPRRCLELSSGLRDRGTAPLLSPEPRLFAHFLQECTCRFFFYLFFVFFFFFLFRVTV